MKYSFVCLLLMLFPYLAFANLDSITWKGTYYQATPNRAGITDNYCKEHTPGSFIHVVKDALAHPIITNKGIKLDQAFFNLDKIDGIYLIHGSFLATGNSAGIQWQDRIYYYLYKYSEAGITKGIWYSKDCKGFYRGIAVRNKMSKLS